ncbi:MULTISPECIES: XisI protein [Moorena]|uniref:XisI protein n=3 Tax=Moorena TaxID=1155738 RepID=A0A1D9FXH3_MOOP1|nr:MULTISPECIES: XisI protein [Moorena]NEQ16546.1 XisI protein [Moorena sp. SIO3E2]AOY79985.2 XisI protein [Moorena producens JHB]EGJ35398.1 XisI protein [Moorena producens 3L]NEP68624.1 XisI protein [Moorena sp. SIO3A5]NEQ07977.1 XisI protein [Moorena sp. SIO4E2]
METTNQRLEQWRETLENILKYYANLPDRYGDVTTSVIISGERNHFLLVHEGWENHRRVYGTIVHGEIRDGKIWIHYDGIEDGITDELVASGVPKDRIVLAFHPPEIREHSGYAIA